MNADLVQGGMFTVMVVRVDDPNDPNFESQLAEQVARSPAFFANAPVVLDLKNATGCATADAFQAIRRLLKRQHLIIVGIQNGNATQIRAAMNADLAAFPAAPARRPEAEARTSSSATAAASAPPPRATPPHAAASSQASAAAASARPGTKIVTQPVRSGTQIYARGGDLVVLNAVSPGAEVIADGHVHIYGPLRGRAIAGAAGDTDARIFIEKLEAELVCVAGHYLVSEAIAKEYIGQPVQVTLENGELVIARR